MMLDVTKRGQLERQLQQAQKMEAIGTLAGGIAHDFNNILTIILGNTELALIQVPNLSSAKDSLKEVRTACNRAKELTQQILTFSRQSPSEIKTAHIPSIVRESLKLLRPSLPSSIEIRQNICVEMDTILGDPTQIHQVLINLCTNAAHAMEEGGTLEIELNDHILDERATSQYHDVTPGRYVRLTIKDTGHGMTPDILDRIFDPYFTTKEMKGGTGLGLAVVHGIVKNHKGGIAVSSVAGEGSTFDILFPVAESKPTEAHEASNELPGGRERILFVDDEQALVRLNQGILERLGYQVKALTNPLDALELFRSHPDQFDLIITDTTMPHMTGNLLAQEILKIRSDIPILLCTGYSAQIDKDKAKEMGIAGFALKPLNMFELARTVRELLDHREKG